MAIWACCHSVMGRSATGECEGGGVVLVLAEVYLDESYEEGSPILCVAGYLFWKRKAKKFARDWRAYLDDKGLPYFHMAEVPAARYGRGIFATPELAEEVERELIKRTRKATEIGFASTINEDDYAELVQPREGMRSAYATALLSVMVQVRRWCERTDFNGQIAFVFERGHPHQGDADEFMKWLFASERVTARMRYGGHAFLPKETPCLHPADLLAWQWRLEWNRQLSGKRKHGVRKDLEALVRPHDLHMDWNRSELEILARDMTEAERRRADAIREALETGIMPGQPDNLV
jgi:hypothetical protein